MTTDQPYYLAPPSKTVVLKNPYPLSLSVKAGHAHTPAYTKPAKASGVVANLPHFSS